MSGWKSMSCPLRAMMLVICMISTWVYAMEENGDNDVPSLEMLEFLGEWETSDGVWIDPGEFEDDSFEQLIEPVSVIENE